MNDQERAAMQQALEALKNGKRVRVGEGGTKFHIPLEDNAITALRAALAQQAEQEGKMPRVWQDVQKKLNVMEREHRAALMRMELEVQAEPQITHSSECWRWHHKCAVAKIERECKHD